MPMKHTLILALMVSLVSLPGCVVVKKLVGADIDPQQFARAREARMVQVRADAAQRLADRLGNGDAVTNADVCFTLGQTLLNRVAEQYRGMTGWLDPATSYTVTAASVTIHNGAAFASLMLTAHNTTHDVDVDLAMDCIITLSIENGTLVMLLEPFNITPVVNASGVLAATEGIIENIIRIRLATMSRDFPPMTLPVDFSSTLPMAGVSMDVKSRVNVLIEAAPRSVASTLTIREFQFFEGLALVTLNLSKVEVK